jgi:hypothetical protein
VNFALKFISRESRIRIFLVFVELLKDRKDVVSTGLSGIGKSAEVNGLLMEFLANVGKWVGRRKCGGVMSIFSLESGVPCVRDVEAKTLKDVSSLTRQYKKVLLIFLLALFYLLLFYY